MERVARERPPHWETEHKMPGNGLPEPSTRDADAVEPVTQPNVQGVYYQKSWALIIGINDYGGRHAPLLNARNDATKLAELCRETYRFEEVHTLYDEEATGATITGWLRDELPARTHRDDRVFIFFAGHGITQETSNGGKRGYLVPHEARKGKYADYINMDELLDACALMPAKHILIILDCCFSGIAAVTARASPPRPPAVLDDVYLRRITELGAWQILTAGASDELAADSGILPGHSAFTSALLAGLLTEADTNDDGLITASELADYVAPRVSRETHRYGQGQTPFFNYLMGSQQGNFVFFVPGKTPRIPSAPSKLTGIDPPALSWMGTLKAILFERTWLLFKGKVVLGPMERLWGILAFLMILLVFRELPQLSNPQAAVNIATPSVGPTQESGISTSDPILETTPAIVTPSPKTPESEDIDSIPSVTSTQEIVTPDGFFYIGEGLSIEEFKEYVLEFDFGTVPPHAIVLGHTSDPWTLEARNASQPPEGAWNAGERSTNVYNKRLLQLEIIMRYFKEVLGWDRGPHLYIDDRYIWLFTPMDVDGFHSASGNQFSGGYSIGIKIIGNFDEVRPSGSQWENTRAAMGILVQCLSIPIAHRPSAPGISYQWDYQDRSSPGAAISEDWVIKEVRQWVEANPIHCNDT